MSKIMKNLQLQQTDLLVCDAEFYALDPPADQVEALQEQCATVSKVVVCSNDGSSASDSILFGSASTIDAYTYTAL